MAYRFSIALLVLFVGCAADEGDTDTLASAGTGGGSGSASGSSGSSSSNGSTSSADPSATASSAAETQAGSTSEGASNDSHGEPVYEDPESKEIVALCTMHCAQLEVADVACGCLEWCQDLATNFFVGTFANYVECQMEFFDAETCGCAEGAVECPTYAECADEEECGTKTCWGG